MKRLLILSVLLLFPTLIPVWAQEGHDAVAGRASEGSSSTHSEGSGGAKAAAPARSEAVRSFRPSNQSNRPASRSPIVINMSRPAPKTNNPRPQPAQRVGNNPTSYGRVQWQSGFQTAPSSSPFQNRPQRSNPSRNHETFTSANPSIAQPGSNQLQNLQPRTHYVPATHSFTQRPDVTAFKTPGIRVASVVHHHPYTTGYVRKRLQNIGVRQEPSYITDRSEIVNTDRRHSTIALPKTGPNRVPFNSVVVSARHFNDPFVLKNMARVNDPGMLDRIDHFNTSEITVNHYYWHHTGDIDYCHYIDPYGYHWYGWYQGEQCFWTRYYGDRWWWYDGDWGRWCFWHDGFWWWQDPYHVGDLYCYTNTAYIPCNSAEDQIVVTSQENSSVKVYQSPDATRLVKIVNDTQDAFLYDNSDQPQFSPVYLATGVQNVQFSNPQNGRPLEILVTLTDGSFDVYDGEGNAYNPGSFDADQASQADAPSMDIQTITPGNENPDTLAGN